MSTERSPRPKSNPKVKCGFCGKEKPDSLDYMCPTKHEGKRICRSCWRKRQTYGSFANESWLNA